MFYIKEVLAIIPARGGSKGLPRKNIRQLNGKPLIAYTIDAAKKSKYITRTIVNTDDEEIAEVAKKYGAEVPFIRPACLAEDDVKSIDVLTHTLRWFKKYEKYTPKIVVFLQPTSPLRNHCHIDHAVELFLKTDANSVISVCEFEHSPYWSSRIENNRLVPLLDLPVKDKRRQELPKTYRYNGAIYISSMENILKYNTFFRDIEPYIMEPEDSVDIDTWMDFRMVEIILESKGKEEM